MEQSKPTLETFVKDAQAGSRDALEFVVEQIQNMIYGLSLRMLWHPEDARDATQEILIRVITHLGGFRGESSFKTWVYRVAGNYLITARKSRLEKQNYTFERFGGELDENLSDESVKTPNRVDEILLLEEIKIGCTLGMLLCLDRGQRLAYILGEILEIGNQEAAEILEITPAAYRKRLSRARVAILEFMKLKCGIVDPANACRCGRRVQYAVKSNRVNPDQLLFAAEFDQTSAFSTVVEKVRKLDDARRAVAVYRSHPQFTVSKSFVPFVKKLLISNQ